MMHTPIYKKQAILLFFVLCGIFGIKASAQNQNKALDELKEKYPWGSIYLTTIPINDLTNTLNDQRKLEELFKREDKQLLLEIARFLKTHKKPELNIAIAFIEIDFDRGRAGFNWANDNRGRINDIPWSKKQVVQTAILSDKSLKGCLTAQNLYDSIKTGIASIKEAWVSIKKIHDDPYIPYEKVAPLLAGLEDLIEKKPGELSRLMEKDKPLYEALVQFKNTFDVLSPLENKMVAFKRLYVAPNEIHAPAKSLYERLGGRDAIAAVVDEFWAKVATSN